MRESPWAYPALQSAHLIDLAVLVGAVVVLDVHLLGERQDLPVVPLARHVLPWVWAGFGVTVVSGALLFLAQAMDLIVNPAFQLKLVLLVVAGLNALRFHARTLATAPQWESGRTPRAAQITALLSLVLWGVIIVSGRLIAYV